MRRTQTRSILIVAVVVIGMVGTPIAAGSLAPTVSEIGEHDGHDHRLDSVGGGDAAFASADADPSSDSGDDGETGGERSTRTIADRELQPGQSTTVTVEANPNETTDFTLVEEFDPAFANVELVDADGADIADVRPSNGSLFATYVDRSQAELVYEVTLAEWPEAAEGDVRSVDGFYHSHWNRSSTGGDADVTVAREEFAPEFAQSTRTIDERELRPGQSTTVTVEATAGEPSDFTLVEKFDPALVNVELVDADGADFTGVRTTDDALYATYSDREEVTLVYEAKVSARSDSYAFDGITRTDASKGTVDRVTDGNETVTVTTGQNRK